MAKMVHAFHKETGERQWVPSTYVDNPNVFRGVFTLTDPAAKRKYKPRVKTSSTEPVEETVETIPYPQAPAIGDNEGEVIPDA